MWARLLTVGLGIWLMASPAILSAGAPAAHVDRIVGTLATAIAIVAASEVTRPLRWANLPVGAFLSAAPWLFGYGAAGLPSLILGVALGALSFVRGSVNARFGGGWSSLWKKR